MHNFSCFLGEWPSAVAHSARLRTRNLDVLCCNPDLGRCWSRWLCIIRFFIVVVHSARHCSEACSVHWCLYDRPTVQYNYKPLVFQESKRQSRSILWFHTYVVKKPGEWNPSKHKTVVYHLNNVGPTSKTLGLRCTNVIQMFCVSWDGRNENHIIMNAKLFSAQLLGALCFNVLLYEGLFLVEVCHSGFHKFKRTFTFSPTSGKSWPLA